MKRLFLLGALAIVAIMGINTTTASAGNCAFSTGYINGPHDVHFQAVISNCTGVSRVQFGTATPSYVNGGRGWFYDGYLSQVWDALTYYGGTGTDVQAWPANNLARWIYYARTECWYATGVSHQMTAAWKGRIESANYVPFPTPHVVYSWGSYVTAPASPVQSFACYG